MPGIGRKIGDAYVDVHGDLGPFRRDVRNESGKAGAEAGDEFDKSLGARLGRLRLSLGSLRKSLSRINSSLAERFEGVDIGLGRLRGSRNDFLNIVGGMAGALERTLGGAIQGVFQGLGSVIGAFGRTLVGVEGPLGKLGQGIDKLGLSISRIGGGGLDGLLVQIAAVILSFQFLVAITGPLAAGVSGLAAAFVALAVGIGGAIAGGLLALGPALTALAAGVGALTIAFTGLSKQQQAVFEPLKTLFEEVRRSVQGALFKNAGDQVNSLVGALRPLGGLLTSLAGVFSNWATDVLAAIGPGGALSGSFDTLGKALPNLLRTTLDIISGLAGGLTGLFAGATPGAQRLFDGIAAVAAQFNEWANSVSGQQAINTFMQDAVDLLNTLWDIATEVGTTLKNLWDLGAADSARLILEGVVGVFEDLNKAMSTPEGRQAVREFFVNGVQVIRGLGPVLQQIINLFQSLDNRLTRLQFQEFLNGVTSIISGIVSFVRWTQSIINALGRFNLQIQAGAKRVSDFAVNVAVAVGKFKTTVSTGFNAVMKVIGSLVTRILSLRSPMTLAAQSGQRLRAQIVSAFTSLAASVSRAVSQVMAWLGNLARSAGQAAGQAVRALLNLAGQAGAALGRFVGAIRTGISNALSTLGRFAGQAVSAVSGLAGRFAALGGDIMRGLYNGIVGAAGRVVSYIQGLADQVASAFARVLGMASPSRLFAKFGGYIIDGLVIGMRRQERDAEQAGDDVALSVVEGAQRGLQSARQSLKDTALIVFNAVAEAGSAPRLSKAFQRLGAGMIRALTNGLTRGREDAAADIKTTIERIGGITENLMKGQNARFQRAIRRQGSALQDWVKSQGAALDAVWAEVDRAGARIESARDRLKDLLDQFAQLRDSTTESLRGELDLGGAIDETSGKATFESVAAQVSGLAARMKTFARLLKRLIAEGIPPALVQEVAALGSVQGAEVARALLSGSDTQRASLIDDFKSIEQSTKAIGTALAEQMFGAGIEAQKGLIKGLEANREALLKAARTIAKTITDEIKRELGIRSPSTVFQTIGTNIAEGLARGIEGGTERVGSALTGLVNPSVLENVNPPISSLATQNAGAPPAGVGAGGIAAGAITIVTPYANPRLVAIEALDALAAQGK